MGDTAPPPPPATVRIVAETSSAPMVEDETEVQSWYDSGVRLGGETTDTAQPSDPVPMVEEDPVEAMASKLNAMVEEDPVDAMASKINVKTERLKSAVKMLSPEAILE